MVYNLEKVFLMFFIYSFLGWTIEMIMVGIHEKKIANRGFLMGPYCPIYGFGAVMITIFLGNKYNIVITFLIATIICTALEYLTSYFMEKIFNARWWDYSDKKFNINGRVCFENAIWFGILGCLIIYVLNTIFSGFIDVLPLPVVHIITIILLMAMILDTAVSCKVVSNLKHVAKIAKDNTEEISQKVRKIIENKSKLHSRLTEAYPMLKLNFKDIIKTGKKKAKKISSKEIHIRVEKLDFTKMFYYFIIYSFIGYVIETLFALLNFGILESRQSFLYGPFCGIYGLGATVMIIALRPNQKNRWKTFVGGMIVGSITEYVLSFLGQKIFNIRWWDYSDRFLNINGRICLLFTIFWGLLAIFLIRVVNPVSDRIYVWLKRKVKLSKTVIIVLFAILMLDMVVSAFAVDLFETEIIVEYNLKVEEKEYIEAKYNQIIQNDFIQVIRKNWITDEVILKAYPNLKILQSDGEVIWIKDLMPQIKTYIYKFEGNLLQVVDNI